MCNSKLESTRLYAEKLYKKLIEIQFDLKWNQEQDTEVPLKSIQIMFDELREKLLALNIRTNFSDIQEDALLKVCFISEKTSVIEKIMIHVQNIVTILIKLQNKGDCDTNDAQNKEILNVLELARNILYYARVVEGKLDVATDCRDQFGHIRLHDLSSRQNILDAVEAVNMLIPQLEKLSNQLKAVGIEEELSFSLYGPLELAYIENYFVMLLMGRLNIYNQLIEKCQEIQSLIERLKKIIRLLQDKI